MTVFRQSHSQQMRTWGHATATLRRNCACGAGKGRMRAGRLTWQRQEKPTCAQVALFTESVAVNRDNDRQGLRIAQAQARGILGSKRPSTSQHPSYLAWLESPLFTPSVLPSNLVPHCVFNESCTHTGDTRYIYARAQSCIYSSPFKVGRLDVKINNQQSNHQANRKSNQLIASGSLAFWQLAGVKARGILLGIAVYDWLINDKNNNKNSYLKTNNS